MSEWAQVGHQDWCQVRLTPGQVVLDVHRCAKKLYTNFHEAADYTALLLAQEWGDRDLYLALSGGSDSEYVATALTRNNIKFTPYIFKIPGINDEESWYAEWWCRKNNTTPIVETVSLAYFQNNIWARYVPQLLNARLTGYVINLYVCDQIQKLNGYCITGVGDINLEHQTFFCDVVDFAGDLFRTGQHPSGFFMYTPEIAASYLYQFDMSLDEQMNKMSFYQITPRPKFHIHNKLLDHNPKISAILKLRNKRNDLTNPHHYGTKLQTLDLLLGKTLE
jgi:hypothetical protein